MGHDDPDDLRQLFTGTMRDIQAGIHKPAVRDVIARARGTRRHAPAGKPAPLAAILAVGATPLVVVGAVLVGPAGADIFSGDAARPLPAATVATEEPLPPLASATPLPSLTTDPTTTGGATALTPLTEVTVYFADGLLVEDGCRRLTAATRLVPADQLVQGALESLVAGPRANERAVGLVSQFAAEQASPPVTVTTDPGSRVAVVDTDESFFAGTTTQCRYDETWRSLERTIKQFDGWSFELRLAGSADAAAGLVAEDSTRPLDPAADLSPNEEDTGATSTAPSAPVDAGGQTAAPESPAAISTRVARFTLVDADSDDDIGPLLDGQTISLSELPTGNLSIRADTEPAAVGSVGWVFDGVTRPTVENNTPYAIRGDVNGDYIPWTPPLGTHQLQAIPYSAPGGSGTPGSALTISFTVVE